MFILWPMQCLMKGILKITPIINVQIFIRLFPKWIISLSQYGSQYYSKAKEGIWKGSCKVKSAIQVTSPVLISIMVLVTRKCYRGRVHRGPKPSPLCFIPLPQPSQKSFIDYAQFLIHSWSSSFYTLLLPATFFQHAIPSDNWEAFTVC